MASIFFSAARRATNSANFSFSCLPLFSSPGTLPIFNRIVAVGSTPSPRFFSSGTARVLADENMGRLIQDKINEIGKIVDEGLPVPENFPFEIVDNASEKIVILKRDFDAEKINVEVSSSYPAIAIEIDKGEGRLLRFQCSGDKNQRLTLQNVEFEPREDGAFWHTEYYEVRDKALERALLKYLAARGFDSSFVENTYLANKKRKKTYFEWLMKMKDFVEM